MLALVLPAVGAARTGPIRMIGNLLSGLAAPLPDPIDYSALRGLPKSFGKEAGEHALKGVVPAKSKDGWCIATFGGGCFWGTELHFQRIPGVVSTCVGYTQGKLEKPTYREVCGGRTGHTEATMVLFDPKKVTYSELVEVLLKTIDPTLKDQVGNDYGTQYRCVGTYRRLSTHHSLARSHLHIHVRPMRSAHEPLPPCLMTRDTVSVANDGEACIQGHQRIYPPCVLSHQPAGHALLSTKSLQLLKERIGADVCTTCGALLLT